MQRGKIHGLIEKPGSHLGHDVPLKFVQKGAHGRKSAYAELNLTSMVDMLTILVVFLLQTFSASGELLSVSKNIVLPDAVNFKESVVSFDVDGPARRVDEVNAALRRRGILGGTNLARDFPELGESALFCVTEVHTKQDIDDLAAVLAEAVP